MEEQLLKFFGIFVTVATLIISAITYLAKRIVEQLLSRDLEKFKSNLQSENEKARIQFEKEIESYKADLNLAYSKQIQLYSRKSEIIEELYHKLVDLNFMMLDLTALFRNITGKDELAINAEEVERVNKAAEAGNVFFKFYAINKIYFEKDTCLLIENLQKQFRQSYSEYLFVQQFGAPQGEMNYRMAIQASDRVKEDLPKLMEKIEDDFRNTIGVIEKERRNYR